MRVSSDVYACYSLLGVGLWGKLMVMGRHSEIDFAR